MDIAGISDLAMTVAHTSTLSDVGVALLSKTLDQAEVAGAEMIKMMERSVNPSVGGNFDVRV